MRAVVVVTVSLHTHTHTHFRIDVSTLSGVYGYTRSLALVSVTMWHLWYFCIVIRRHQAYESNKFTMLLALATTNLMLTVTTLYLQGE